MLRFTFKHAVVMITFIAILTYLQATVLRFMVPPFTTGRSMRRGGTT